MPRPLLPPKGVIIPPHIAYDTKMAPAARDTYMQLRGLAWGKKSTPELTMEELSTITGKSQSTIYGHLAYLRDWGVLRYVPSGDKSIKVTFIDTKGDDSENLESLLNSSSTDINSIKSEEGKAIGTFQNSGKKPIASKRSTADPRSKSPAIQCVKGITSRYPPKELYDDIIRVLGESPDGELLTACRKEWLRRGYNPSGWPWLFDWYPAGGPPGRNGRTPSTPDDPNSFRAAILASKEKYKPGDA
jgi:DNA-binding transcriptional ArsR family regulator